MGKKDKKHLSEGETKEVLYRFRKSLALGRRSYFDVSEFEDIVDYLLDDGEINTAEIAVRQGMQIHPGAVPLLLKYAQVLVNLEKYNEAMEYINMVEPVEATNPDVHVLKGLVWLLLDKENEAEVSFNTAVSDIDSEDDETYYQIGSAYIQAGDIEKAILYFEKALDLNPENEFALNDLCFFSDQEGDFHKSVEYYNKYLDHNPYNFSIWYNLGISYSRAGEYEKAIEAYEYAIALNEAFSPSLYYIGNAYVNTGNYKKALDKYFEYLEYDPANDDVYSSMGDCYAQLEEYKTSEKYYRKALDINPENDAALFGIGILRRIFYRWKQSLTYIRKALRIDPSNAGYWIALAKIYVDNNKPKKAEEALTSSMEIQDDNPELWIEWTEFHMKYFGFEKALETLQRGMEICDDYMLNYQMVILYLENGFYNEGYEWFQKALSAHYESIDYFLEAFPEATNDEFLNKIIADFKSKDSL